MASGAWMTFTACPSSGARRSCVPRRRATRQPQPTLPGDPGSRVRQELAEPGCVRQDGVLDHEGFVADWVYIAAIKHVLTIKTGAPFSEVAPMLFDISGLPSWERVLRGLVRLYLGEVLGKFPVVQHFVFGNLIPADWVNAEGEGQPNRETARLGQGPRDQQRPAGEHEGISGPE
eukprot:scaffold47_cov258-Pinguiococcus_pyrenoidosus.AAC.64